MDNCEVFLISTEVLDNLKCQIEILILLIFLQKLLHHRMIPTLMKMEIIYSYYVNASFELKIRLYSGVFV